MGLEQAWGSFKLNLYYLVGMAGTAAAAFLLGSEEATGVFLNLSLTLAFATLFPELPDLAVFRVVGADEMDRVALLVMGAHAARGRPDAGALERDRFSGKLPAVFRTGMGAALAGPRPGRRPPSAVSACCDEQGRVAASLQGVRANRNHRAGFSNSASPTMGRSTARCTWPPACGGSEIPPPLPQ